MSTNLICPHCHAVIDPAKVNVATDLAQCTACNAIHQLSKLMSANSESLDNMTNPPRGSRIIFQKSGDKIEIELPKKGFQPAQLGLILFATFWIGFISFWTWGAAQGSIFFALFSIPFWVVGVFMVIGIFNNMYEKHKLSVGESSITLEKYSIEKTANIEYSIDEIYSIEKQSQKLNAFNKNTFRFSFNQANYSQKGIMLPAISTGSETEFFFENASSAEQEWIVKFLSAWVKRYQKK